MFTFFYQHETEKASLLHVPVQGVIACFLVIPYFPFYIFKLFSFSKKSKSPMVSIPASFRRGMTSSLTTMIFLNESWMFIREQDSCISLSLSGIDNADCT